MTLNARRIALSILLLGLLLASGTGRASQASPSGPPPCPPDCGGV